MNAPRITIVGSYATGLTMKVERLPSRGDGFAHNVIIVLYDRSRGGECCDRARGWNRRRHGNIRSFHA